MKLISSIALILFSTAVSANGQLRLTNETREPISGARVSFTLSTSQSATMRMLAVPQSFTSNVNGVVEGLTLPSAGHALLTIDHPDYPPVAQSFRPGAIPHTLVMAVGQTRKLLLVAPDGIPIAGSDSSTAAVCASGTLEITGWPQTHRWRRCSNVNASGEAVLRGLPHGTFALEAAVPGFLPLHQTVGPDHPPVLALETGILLKGLVTDSRGRPIAGSKVLHGGSVRAAGDGDGKFILAVADLPLTIQVVASGFRSESIRVAEPGLIRLVMNPATQLLGIIRGDGGPLVGPATLWIDETAAGMRRSTPYPIELADGAFSLDLPAEGTYNVRIAADGYRETRLPTLHIENGDAFDLGVISLARAAGISGQALDGWIGRPAAGAVVEVLPLGASIMNAILNGGAATSIADSEGRFTLGGLEPGRYLVRVQIAERAAVLEFADLEKPQIKSLGVLTLGTGSTLQGKVLDRSNRPQVAARVMLFDPAREFAEPLYTTETDLNGQFHIEHVPHGIYRAEVREYRLLLSQQIEVRGETPFEIDFRAGGGTIFGTVVREGSPVAGGTVTMTSALDPGDHRGKMIIHRSGTEIGYGLPESRTSSSVDSNGRFTLSDPPEGLVRFTYRGTDARLHVRWIRLDDSEEHFVTLDLSGERLEGRVVDTETNVGLTGTVTLLDLDGRFVAEVHTDPSGAFIFDSLSADAYALVAASAGYATKRVQPVGVAPTLPPVVVPLERGGGGDVTVVLATSEGKQLAGIPVSLYGSTGLPLYSLPTMTDGSRTFSDLPPGEYAAVWYEPLNGLGIAASIRPRPFEETTISSRLEPGASISFRCPLQTCRNSPIDRVEIRSSEGTTDVSPLLPGISSSMKFSSDGEIALGRLSPGEYTFKIVVNQMRWTKDVTVGSTPLEIVLD